MSAFFSDLLAILIASIFPTVTTNFLFTIQRKLRIKYKTVEYSALTKNIDKFAFTFINMDLIKRIFIGIFIGLVMYKLVFVVIGLFE